LAARWEVVSSSRSGRHGIRLPICSTEVGGFNEIDARAKIVLKIREMQYCLNCNVEKVAKRKSRVGVIEGEQIKSKDNQL
jgi:hypothetical protein